MKNVNYLIVFSSIVITIGAMERNSSDLESFKKRAEERFAEIENERVFLEKPKVVAPENKTLSALSKELHKLGILVNLNAKSEKEIFSFTDKLIQKGPGSAKLVRKMIQEYARNKNHPNWEKYTYKQFKLDVMDKIINEKTKEFKKEFANREYQKFLAAQLLKAYIWSKNEVKINIDYQNTLNNTLAILDQTTDNFVESLKLGANSFAWIKIRLSTHQIEPLIIRAASNNSILENILKYDDNYDVYSIDKAKNKLEALKKNIFLKNDIPQALYTLKRIQKKFYKKLNENLDKNLKLHEEKEDLKDQSVDNSEWKEEKLEDLIQKSQELQLQAKKFEKKPSSSNTPSSSKGWFSGLSDWWYGSDKEEKK